MRKRAAFWRWAQGLLAAERIGGRGGLPLCRGQRRLGLGGLPWQGSQSKIEAGALQIQALQFHEVFNLLLHSCYEVYGIRVY